MATLPSLVSARVLIAATSLVLILGAQAEADVTLALSKPAYEVGEPVRFTLANDTKCVITLLHAAGWWHIRDSQGVVVGGCYIVPLEVDVLPGQSLAESWDQHSCREGTQVPKGRYYLAGAWVSYDDCPDGYQILHFDIGMVPIEPTTWGGIKGLFRER
jgi:hypothetical protein